MFEIDDPVDYYNSNIKDAYARNVSNYFEEFVQKSGVDEDENKKRVAEIRNLQKALKKTGNSNSLWQIIRWIAIGGIVISGIMAYIRYQNKTGLNYQVETAMWALAVVALVVLIFAYINPKIKGIKAHLATLRSICDEKISSAWQQTAPLNALFTWDDFSRLVSTILPEMVFDSYFTRSRLANLCDNYGFDESFNQGRSILFAHSGTLVGHPFVFSKSIEHWMGQRTYHGSLEISWTTVEKDSQGNFRTVRHNQTLTASVDKPFPEYAEQATLVYGNTAAPDLSFSRNPSSLSNAGDGLIGKWRKAWAVKKLESKARKIKDGGGFTVMANRDFDALFNATDRDNEVQFRMMFTPLAQQSMVKLLRDQEVGFGDSFSFSKANMINVITSGHLQDEDISADPVRFQNYDIGTARSEFNSYHNALFKGLYFTFAPLFLISLYQQQKPTSEIETKLIGGQASYWEHEAIVNSMGEQAFAHPESVTRNLLRVDAHQGAADTHLVEVTAYGYYGRDRIDYISVYGRDGNTHSVPVPWVEYLPISRDSKILVSHPKNSEVSDRSDEMEWQRHFIDRGVDLDDVIFWRGIRAARV